MNDESGADPTNLTGTQLDGSSPLQLPEGLPQLEGYAFEAPLGQGGMGLVFAGRDQRTGERVAIKLIAPHLSHDATIRKRFLREVEAVVAVQGPHIIPVRGFYESRDNLYLVMDYLGGGSLQQWIRQHPQRNLEWAVSIGRQVAQGLVVAHAAGLIHRDIKPSNILLDETGTHAWVGDFGLVALLDASEQLTSIGHAVGTPAYMSPEQVRGEPLDHRTDLFSLGCVIYAMIAGDSPFRSANAAAAEWKVTAESPAHLGSVDATIPDRLVAVIDRLLQKDREARFASAAEVDLALSHCFLPACEPTLPYLSEPPPVTPRKLMTRRHMALAALASVIVVAISLIFAFWPSPAAKQAPAMAEAQGRSLAAVGPAATTVSQLAVRRVRRWTVAAGSAADFRSVADALRAAESGDEIVVMDDAQYDGPVVINEPYRLRGIRLRAPRHASLRMSHTGGRLATLSIDGTRDVQIQGFRIEGGHEHHAIEVRGDVAGTELTDLIVAQPAGGLWAALLLARGCRGTAESPFVIRTSRISTEKYGVFCGRDDVPDSVEAEHVRIEGNLFAGGGTHVHLANAVRNIRIEHNIFRQGTGLEINLQGKPISDAITVCNNTFYQVSRWIVFGPDRNDHRGRAFNNLLIQSVEPIWTDNHAERVGMWEFDHNVVEDRTLADKAVHAPFGERVPHAGVNSVDADSPHFLKPLSTGRAATGGAGAELPSYVGALAPEPRL
ncbi:MAG TPA: serine/threonine-protein kinase [Chloroflexota bacterium]|nr:serine/threonine-protein kinase [Chloroflexota bacterium]